LINAIIVATAFLANASHLHNKYKIQKRRKQSSLLHIFKQQEI